MGKIKHKQSRRLSSIAFRINIILIFILVIVGWGFTKTVTLTVNAVSNINRMATISKVVNTGIANKIEQFENVVKTCSFASQQRRMTTSNSTVVRDSIIESVNDIDTVYLAHNHALPSDVEKCVQMSHTSGASLWSEPHWTSHKGKEKHPVVTFVTPLRNSKGDIYDVLCADISLSWIKELVDNEILMGDAYVTVASSGGIFLYHRDNSLVMKKVSEVPDEMKQDTSHVVNLINNRFVVNDKWEDNEDGEDDNNDESTLNASQDGEKSNTSKVIDRTGWKVNCVVPLRDNSEMKIIITGLVVVMLFFLFITIISVIIIIVNWQLKPLSKISDAADAIATGDFSVQLPEIGGHSEISHLRESFVTMQQQLIQYIDDLRVTTEHKANMERDLEIASKIQIGMLPKHFSFSDKKNVDIYGMLDPAKEVGGDIFDFFFHDNRLAFIIGDVSGKGVPASLFMTVVGHLFRNVGRYSSNPATMVSVINNGLAEGNEQNMFCTLFCGVLNLDTGKLEYCNAGHNAPILIHKGVTNYLTPNVNLPAGALADFKFEQEDIILSPGDTLFLYTDGVTEAENRQKELFGEVATLSTVDINKECCMEDLICNVYQAVTLFAGGAEQSDDITMLAIKWKDARGKELGEINGRSSINN